MDERDLLLTPEEIRERLFPEIAFIMNHLGDETCNMEMALICFAQETCSIYHSKLKANGWGDVAQANREERERIFVETIEYIGYDGLVHNEHTPGRNRKTCPACQLLRLAKLIKKSNSPKGR